MSRDRHLVWHRGARLWAVALLLAAMLLTVVSVAVAAEGELPSGHVTPAFGPATGGTPVTISGSGFTGATGVTFGGIAAPVVAINGDGTVITATTPVHDVGATPVVVTQADGTTVTVGGFFFIPVVTATTVTVTSVNPAIGSTAGHTPVVIIGSGFREDAHVTFGDVPATEVHILADAIIIALTPAHNAGAVTVTVTNTSGQSGSLDTAFTYATSPPAAAPTIARIEPPTAPASSLSPTSTALDDHHGQVVAIIGTGFQPNAAVTFDGTPVDHTTTISSTVILTTPPAHAAGKVDVVVTDPDGQSATSPQQFTYVVPTPGTPPATAALTISEVEPRVGLAAGGARVRVRGSGFTDGMTVTFDTTVGTGIEIVDSTHLFVTTPAHAVGPVNVIVTNTAGQTDTLLGGYGYMATMPDHRSPGITNPASGQPPAPLPTSGRKNPGAPNLPGTAGTADTAGAGTSPNPAPLHR
jgi:hypothetical protein